MVILVVDRYEIEKHRMAGPYSIFRNQTPPTPTYPQQLASIPPIKSLVATHDSAYADFMDSISWEIARRRASIEEKRRSGRMRRMNSTFSLRPYKLPLQPGI